MSAGDKPYFVEINDWAPDVLEYRAVADQDWRTIAFQPEAYLFAFYERAKGQAHPPVSDWFYLTTDPRVLTAKEALEEFPDYAGTIEMWASHGVKLFGNHAYDHGGKKGGRIIPMMNGIVFIDRKAMTQVWPAIP
jgi:hypothetical protein